MNATIENTILNENISNDNDAIEFIANIFNNNLKAIIQSFQKFKLLDKHIDILLAKELCCSINFVFFEEYFEFLLNKDFEQAVKLIMQIHDDGYAVIDILDSFFLFLKKTNMIEDEMTKYDILKYVCKYISIFYNTHEDSIELVFFTKDLIKVMHSY